MTEPQRTDSARTPASPDAERATRIEELLISGLDHYFAEDYEQAINVWTRVVFLERDHDRARAYIDRARKAIAERQRESEELLHRGLDAYKTGDVESARDLLTRAVDQGAPSDEALVLLDRMDRLEGTGFDAPLHRKTIPARRQAEQSASAERAGKWQWALGALLLAGAGAAVYYGAAPALSWLADVPAATSPKHRLLLRRCRSFVPRTCCWTAPASCTRVDTFMTRCACSIASASRIRFVPTRTACAPTFSVTCLQPQPAARRPGTRGRASEMPEMRLPGL